MNVIVRFISGLCVAVGFVGTPVWAQPWPARHVKFVVPFAPGGQSDVVARMVAEKLSARWGQPVVVENKAGAATTIGADLVAKAPADGYTMLLAPAPFVITQYAYPKLPYDSRRDFTPVALLVTNPLVVVTNPGRMSGQSVAEFVAQLKKNPGGMPYGSPGNGSLPHLAVALFQLQSGTEALQVPYQGGGPAVVDLVAGQMSFMFASPLEVMPHVTSGKLRALAVTGDQRVPYWPQVPTLVESGYPQYQAFAWFGVVVAAATPRDIITRMNADIGAVLRLPDVTERLKAQGADVAAGTPEAFGRFLDAEHERWSAAVKAANVTVQ
ncbi:MAG: Bug family tripartite tricarboxylate transporter substrate binding protein [Betaproteobacteria bacterium]